MFTITMETPGSAPWAGPPRGGVWRAAGPSAQLPPVGRTRRLPQRRCCGFARFPLGPAPQHPVATAPGARAPAVIASLFPRGTPPSPGRRGWKDAWSAAGRTLSDPLGWRGGEGAIVTRPAPSGDWSAKRVGEPGSAEGGRRGAVRQSVPEPLKVQTEKHPKH